MAVSTPPSKRIAPNRRDAARVHIAELRRILADPKAAAEARGELFPPERASA